MVCLHSLLSVQIFRVTSCMYFLLSGMLRRKTLVLDLDETLIHSHHDGVIRETVKPGTPPDFVLKVIIGPVKPK